MPENVIKVSLDLNLKTKLKLCEMDKNWNLKTDNLQKSEVNCRNQNLQPHVAKK